MRARFRRIRRAAGASVLAAAVVLGACADGPQLSGAAFELPETEVDYVAVIEGMPDEEMEELAEEALSLFREEENGARSIALLRRRAENDLDTVQQILRSRGYFNGTAEVAVAEIGREEYAELADRGFELPDLEDLKFWKPDKRPEREPQQFARVLVSVDPGPQFTLASHEFRFLDPDAAASVPPPLSLGSPVGGPAVAVPIVAAEAAAVELLQSGGFPYAENVDRDAVADLALATLEVESALRSGPRVAFGQVNFDGLEDVREDYLRTYIPWEEGELVDRNELRKLQQGLIGTQLFDTVLVTLPPEPPPGVDGPVALPVLVRAEERPFRTVAAGGQYSTDEGPAVTGRFEHRNLWGANETLSIDGEFGIEIQRLLFGYREPQYLRPGQDLLAGLELVREEDDAFDELRATLTAGLQRRLSPEWVVGAGGLLEASQITDNGIETEAFLAGIPTFAEYDDTDDLLNPTEGTRARFDVTPFAGLFDDDFSGFLTIDNRASGYWDVLDDDVYVLAGRVRLGSIIADGVDNVPKNRRLYSGGGGSVRGYQRRFIGPLDAQNDPEGGLSALELGAELRAQVWGDIGGVLFVEAGSVSQESYPDFDEGVQVAAGAGVRYFSPAGPIRLDVAVPLNPRDADDAFQLYFSIGQAF